MRFAMIILVTILLALGASWLIWRDRLTPTTAMTLPRPPTELQRQFGVRISPPLAAALDRPLPATFETGGSLRWTIDRLREVAGAEIIVNWRSLHDAGVDERARVDAALAGRPLREALPALIAVVATREPIGIEADNN